MGVFLRSLGVFIVLGLQTQIATAACKANLGKDWRKVGASNTVKYVCTKEACGGKGGYVIAKYLKSFDFGSQVTLAELKSNGKSTSSPIAGLSGLHNEFTIKNGYKVVEIYYDKNERGVNMPHLVSLANSKATARTNFAKAKRVFSCR